MGRGLLLIVSGMVIIVGIVQKSMSDRLQLMPKQSISYHQQSSAQNAANSLIEYGVRELDNNQNWQGNFSSSDFMGTSSASLEVYDFADFQDGNPGIPSDHDIQQWDQYTVLLVSNAENEEAIAETEVGIAKDSFSRYTYFTDYEPDNIYFFDQDELNGPVHTNGTMHIAGSPVFNGDVTSPNDWEGHPDYENDPQFNGNTNFTSQEIELPGADKMDFLRNEGISGGLAFDDDIFVEFKNNGTVDIAERNGYSGGEPTFGSSINYDLDTINGIISSSKKVYAKGKLKGQVTLHSAKEVEIMGDLTYSRNPTNPNSTDLLGIVSEGNVTVDYNAHKDTGNKDLTIHASIMALDKSFEVEHYAWGNARGTLTLVGGLQQKERGPVGTFGGGQVQSGFSKQYDYDTRMSRMVPPYYPRESIFSLKYWKEKPLVSK